MLARLLVLLPLLAVSACSPAVSPQPAQTPSAPASSTVADEAWQEVPLPARVRPASLAVSGNDLLVGGLATDRPAPRLLRLHAGSVTGEFRLEPGDPNAAAADLVRLSVSGENVYAIGTMIAGAHSNPRLTVWDGTTTGPRLTSRPQEFFTFGGHDAGPLLGTVEVDGSPVIFGSRVGGAGPYGVVWTRTGHTWRQQERPAALSSSPDREFGFSALTVLGNRLLVAGDELGLAGGLTQRPVVFVGGVGRDWQEVALPVPDSIGRVPGQLSRATSVACTPGSRTCWASGWVRGHALAWPVSVPARAAATAADPAVLPGDPPDGNDPTTLLTLVNDRPVVLTNASEPSAQLGCPDGWRSLSAPPVRATAVVAASDALYAVAGERLWRHRVPSC